MRRSDRAAVRALVDGELSASEAQALRQRAAADAALGAYLRQMEATTEALRGLRAVDAPLPAFVRPAREEAPAPRRPLFLNAVAAAAVVVAGGLAWWTLSAPPAATPDAAAPDDGAIPVVLAYSAPQAGQVQVAGDFNAWQPTALTREGDRWATQLRLPPGRYAYMYVVDGRWTADPEAHSFRDDEFGRKNAVLHL